MTEVREEVRETAKKHVGFACAYTPLPLIHAAGLVPYRVLPIGDAPDEAGTLLPDNMCPHIKRVLDRGVGVQFSPTVQEALQTRSSRRHGGERRAGSSSMW